MSLHWDVFKFLSVWLWAHAATAITKKVLMSFDVTTLGSDDDIKEICNLLLRSCQS